MTFLTSKVTWSFVAIFIVGGLEAVNLIPQGVGTTLLALFGITGLMSHNTQIVQGRV